MSTLASYADLVEAGDRIVARALILIADDALGALPICLCSHDFEPAHVEPPLGAPDDYKGPLVERACKLCGDCRAYIPSPYACLFCGDPKTDVESAIFCCVCRGCGHLVDGHRSKTSASILREPTKCSAPYCRCPGFGCEIAA